MLNELIKMLFQTFFSEVINQFLANHPHLVDDVVRFVFEVVGVMVL